MKHGWPARQRMGAPEPALELRQLRAFVALVDHGSMTGAAQAIGLAQSTVSEALAALERVLGTRVVVRRRGSHGLALTAAGHALLPHARGVLAALGDARAAVASAASEAHATVEIITNESVSTYVLPRALAPLRARWPGVRFAVSVATCDDVRAGIADGAFDLGLLLQVDGVGPRAHLGKPDAADEAASSGSHRMSSARAERDDRIIVATNVPLIVFASPSHPLASPRASAAVRRDELAPYALFVSDAAGDFHALMRDFFGNGRVPGQLLEAAGSIEGVKRGVATDHRALGILPAYAVEAELGTGRVAPVTLRPPLPLMELVALLSASRPRHPSVAALLEAVRAAHGGVRSLI